MLLLYEHANFNFIFSESTVYIWSSTKIIYIYIFNGETAHGAFGQLKKYPPTYGQRAATFLRFKKKIKNFICTPDNTQHILASIKSIIIYQD